MYFKIRLVKNKVFQIAGFGLAVFAVILLFIIAIGLYRRSVPILKLKPLTHVLFTAGWHPLRGEFGFLPFILSTLWVTAISLIIAVPLCLLTSIYLSEYSNRRFYNFFRPVIDLLAGIPSVIFGLWGVLMIVPFIRVIAGFIGINTTGYSILGAAIVLAVMISPVIINIFIEVIKSVPKETREASLVLGATKWQTVSRVVLRRSMPGIIAGIVLGLSRAFGETMAVLMVAGNVVKIPSSLFDPAYPLPALIANSYGEMMSIPLFDSALMLAALILLLIVIFFNVISRLILIKIEENSG